MSDNVKFDRYLVVLAHGIMKDGRDMEFPDKGLVEVYSTKLDEMHEFTHFPYSHKDIHFQEDVMGTVCSFLKNGTILSSLTVCPPRLS